MNAAFAATALRWVMLALILVGAAWGLRGLYDWVGDRITGERAASAPPAP